MCLIDASGSALICTVRLILFSPPVEAFEHPVSIRRPKKERSKAESGPDDVVPLRTCNLAASLVVWINARNLGSCIALEPPCKPRLCDGCEPESGRKKSRKFTLITSKG